MIMVGMTTQRKEPIVGLFSLEDISYVKQKYNISLCVPLFIKPYGWIALFVINLYPHKGFKVGQTLLSYWPRRWKPMVGQQSFVQCGSEH